MSIVTLVSGGLDSTLVALLAQETGVEQYPLFIDYGQRARERELQACVRAMQDIGVSPPAVAKLSGFGELIRSGLTSADLDVVTDAFTPGRNLLFLLTGASYAFTVGAAGVAIGLLDESTHLFPDQTAKFLSEAESLLTLALGRSIKVLAPLSEFSKQDVIALARRKNLRGTYSCHVGGALPCGDCIACREFGGEEV